MIEMILCFFDYDDEFIRHTHYFFLLIEFLSFYIFDLMKQTDRYI